MKAEDLIIGAVYQLNSSIGVYIGMRLSSLPRHHFKWSNNPDNWNNYGISGAENIAKLILLALPNETTSFTKQTKVQRKITLLWKTSNYVKKHPNLIY